MFLMVVFAYEMNLFLLLGTMISSLPLIIVQLWGLKKNANVVVRKLRLY